MCGGASRDIRCPATNGGTFPPLQLLLKVAVCDFYGILCFFFFYLWSGVACGMRKLCTVGGSHTYPESRV